MVANNVNRSDADENEKRDNAVEVVKAKVVRMDELEATNFFGDSRSDDTEACSSLNTVMRAFQNACLHLG